MDGLGWNYSLETSETIQKPLCILVVLQFN